MRKLLSITAVLVIFTSPCSFAHDGDMYDKACKSIADACMAAGFVKAPSAHKGMWHNCMKRIILGESVSGVNVDAEQAKSCRQFKIKEMKSELREFEKAN